MSATLFEQRNVKLLIEFDYYMAEHPEIFEQIPNNSWLIVTVDGDEKFNKESARLVSDIKRKKVVEAHKSGTTWSLRPLQAQQLDSVS
jgi:hypothetical protein